MSNPESTLSLNEARSRYILIDPALRNAGWNLNDRTQIGFEIPVDGYDAEPWNGVTDYCLYAPGAEAIAVIEAKRCSRNPREADEQLRYYITEIAKRQAYAPFGFMRG
jgi:type I site-specific restriction endonuclease